MGIHPSGVEENDNQPMQKYEKVVKFCLEESRRIKDAFQAHEDGLDVTWLENGEAEMNFGFSQVDTSDEILASGIIL